MQNNTRVRDVIIVGAGLAGLAAAATCKAAGLHVCVLEAAARCGGRVLTKPLRDHSMPLDWGAEWIIPKLHKEVMAIVAQAGLSLQQDAAQRPTYWITTENRYQGGFTELKQKAPAFAEALQRIESDALTCAHHRRQSMSEEMSLQNYFQSVAANREIAALLEAAVFPLTGGDPAHVSTRMLWDEIGFHDGSIDETLDASTFRIVEGCGSLADALERKLGSDIVYEQLVRKVSLRNDRFEVECGGQLHVARHCILAVPVSVLDDIQFDPQLSDTVTKTARMANAGRVAKTWALVESAEPVAEILNATHQLRYGYARHVNEHEWLVCGQILAHEAEPISAETARLLISQTWPDVHIRSVEVTDWPQQPLAKASWQSSRAGWSSQMAQFHTSTGNLHFAGGDVASRWAGWMEGALICGKEIGQRVVATSTQS